MQVFATVHVYGMGNYTGELTDTFEIDKGDAADGILWSKGSDCRTAG